MQRLDRTGDRDRRRIMILVLVCALITTSAGLGRTEEVVDQVLAVVNQNPILQSDLALARLVRLVDAPPADDDRSPFEGLDARIRLEIQYLDLVASGAERRLDIDLAPVVEQMTQRAGGRDRLRVDLARHGLEWQDVEALALRVAMVRAWIDRHLRPRVSLTVRDIEEAYQRVIVEPMIQAGEEPPSMATVNDRLRTLVLEEKLNEEIERWSNQARERTRVTRFVQ